MSLYAKYLLLVIFIGGCFATQTKIAPKKVKLAEIDSTNYMECYIRYKSDLYEASEELTFFITIHHVTNGLLNSFTTETTTIDSIVLENLNSSYDDLGIRFQIKESVTSAKDYYIEGIVDHYKDFDNRNTLNIVVYHNIDTENGYMYGAAVKAPGTVFGILSTRVHLPTLVHEMGHCFGLPHVFEKDDTDGSTSTHGDRICDTPAYDLMDNRYITNCGWDGTSKYTPEELLILLKNYQNYSPNDRDCRSEFTILQSYATRWFIENTPVLIDALKIYPEDE